MYLKSSYFQHRAIFRWRVGLQKIKITLPPIFFFCCSCPPYSKITNIHVQKNQTSYRPTSSEKNLSAWHCRKSPLWRGKKKNCCPQPGAEALSLKGGFHLSVFWDKPHKCAMNSFLHYCSTFLKAFLTLFFMQLITLCYIWFFSWLIIQKVDKGKQESAIHCRNLLLW